MTDDELYEELRRRCSTQAGRRRCADILHKAAYSHLPVRTKANWIQWHLENATITTDLWPESKRNAANIDKVVVRNDDGDIIGRQG